ncbi:hypothetical protein SAMN05421811_11470 [Nonomuraea wenchangensis]|uniref:Uncharacterized protein n=1 Tax=Nonomuraea wenchangensis TaxID=568860 RepID=A0A1I0LCH0_9ACTN|nr:hypothetical protein SAMN05421811_11470 [Nonomuraea wenchangensis]
MSLEQVPNEHYNLDILCATFPAWSLFRSDAGVF